MSNVRRALLLEGKRKRIIEEKEDVALLRSTIEHRTIFSLRKGLCTCPCVSRYCRRRCCSTSAIDARFQNERPNALALQHPALPAPRGRGSHAMGTKPCCAPIPRGRCRSPSSSGVIKKVEAARMLISRRCVRTSCPRQ